MFGKIFGAMIGAGMGFLAQSGFAALVLAFAGAVAGHLYDVLHEALEHWDSAPLPRSPGRPPRPAPRPPATPRPPDPPESAAERAQKDAYARKLCALFVEVARVDGEVGREEVRMMREYFQQDLGYQGQALNRIRDNLKAAIASPAELDAAAGAVRDSLAPQARTFLLDTLYDLALSDGELKRSERDALRRAASLLEVSEEAHRQVTARYFGTGEQHFAELGLSPAATDEEIRSAYRKLASQHHPDKAAHLGPQAVAAASLRFQRIKDAYEELRLRRGI